MSASNTNYITPVDSAKALAAASSREGGRKQGSGGGLGAGCVNTHTKLGYIRQLRTKHAKPED